MLFAGRGERYDKTDLGNVTGDCEMEGVLWLTNPMDDNVDVSGLWTAEMPAEEAYILTLYRSGCQAPKAYYGEDMNGQYSHRMINVSHESLH